MENLPIVQSPTALLFTKLPGVTLCTHVIWQRAGKKTQRGTGFAILRMRKSSKLLLLIMPLKLRVFKNLKDELRQLGTECHPMDVADWSTDIQAIRAALEILVQNLPRKKIRTVNLSNSEFPQGSFEASINWRKSHKRSVK
jgi:hypothetical protein